MICVLAFSTNDVRQAIELLEWIALLADGKKHPRVLLVADAAVGWVDGVQAIEAAGKAFERAELITNDKPVVGWPQGANSLFFTAKNHIEKEQLGCWLWLEPDALPLTADWYEMIARAYRDRDKPFLGHIYTNAQPEFPRKLMSGIGVYPSIASELFEVQAVAWDMHHADFIVSHAAHTSLIYHFWGQKDLPPTFAEFKTANSPINEMVLENIPKEAVIFHRCKDSSLLNLLRKKQFPEGPQRLVAGSGLLAVIAFCGKDVELCKKNMQWIHDLGGVKNYPCLLSYDDYTTRTHVTEIRKLAEKTFAEVKINAYRARTDAGWPHGPNLAFQATARFVEANYRIPWLWLEADAVPLKSNWLDVLCAEYHTHGKSFYAPVVPRLNHQNGVGIYPWNTASRCPRIMSCTNTAWDFAGMPDTINDRYDAEPFISHVWGEVNGAPHPTEGDAMRFRSVAQVAHQIHPNAVLYHRAKDGSLIAQLREMRKL